MKTIFATLAILFLSTTYVKTQALPDHFLYGTAYYHEYMPAERLETDMKMMREAGLNVIRCGESTWSLFEPREGRFEFAWFDRILDAAHAEGLKVIVGTPTYAIPPWMAKKHPDILVTTFQGKTEYGGRQNMDITNPRYLKYAERMIRQLIAHVKDHPAVIGYQVDNETKSYHTASNYAKEKFIRHLEAKFITPDSLNKTWNLAYWSQSISRFDEFIVSPRWANQAPWLEWNRFQHQLATDFIAWQAGIVREIKRPDQFITQNFDLYWRNDQSTGPNPDVNHFEAARAVDIAGIDVYHQWGNDFDGSVISFAGDYTRSFKHQNYFVLETQAQMKGWSPTGTNPPYDGQIRQAVYSHIASGASMVAYWPWHSIHNGGETYWKGILSHDLQPNRTYTEVSRTAAELNRIGAHLHNMKFRNRVAILYSIESFNALFVKPFSKKYNYADILNMLYKSLYINNISVDFITPDCRTPENYSLIVVPPLYIATDEQLNRIDNYVKQGGNLLLLFKSGFCDENSTVRPTLAPGPLRELCGFTYQEFYNIGQIPVASDEIAIDTVSDFVCEWAEMLQLKEAKPLVTYQHPFWGAYPAAVMHRYGKGTVVYQATVASDSLQEKIVRYALDQAYINSDTRLYFFPIIVKFAENQSGKRIAFFFNYSNQKRHLTYLYGTGTELIENKAIALGDEFDLLPWDVKVIEME